MWMPQLTADSLYQSAVALLLIGCGGSDDGLTIQGRFSISSLGSQKSTLGLRIGSSAKISPILATANIESDGSFSISIPPSSTFKEYLNRAAIVRYPVGSALPAGCTGSIQIDAEQISNAYALFTPSDATAALPLADDRGIGGVGTSVTYEYIFSENAYNAVGNIDCPQSGIKKYSYNEHYVAGWNVHVSRVLWSSETMIESTSDETGSIPEDITWSKLYGGR